MAILIIYRGICCLRSVCSRRDTT